MVYQSINSNSHLAYLRKHLADAEYVRNHQANAGLDTTEIDRIVRRIRVKVREATDEERELCPRGSNRN